MENLHAIVVGVGHDDAPVAVDGDAAIGVVELPVACPLAAKGANMGPIAVAKHLHAMVATFNHNNMSRAIERDASGGRELASPGSCAADGADMRAVTVADNLHSMVANVGNNKVAFTVKRDTTMA